jgi:hypothetical protein
MISFLHCLGTGAYGVVYKGFFQGCRVAVKKWVIPEQILDKEQLQEIYSEFRSELTILT